MGSSVIITIDGPSGTGKSTVAKKFAEALGFLYFDTGALYRAIAWKILNDAISLSDHKGIEEMLKTFSFHVEVQGGQKLYRVGDKDVTKEIRLNEVSAIVSEVSAMRSVREALRPLQEAFSREGPSVFEGRDLGTVVFPNADIKFFLTAREDVRARRRLKDLKEKFPNRAETFVYGQILAEIRKRDELDSTRKLAPLKRAEDAILIDTSDLTTEEVVAVLEKHVANRRV